MRRTFLALGTIKSGVPISAPVLGSPGLHGGGRNVDSTTAGTNLQVLAAFRASLSANPRLSFFPSFDQAPLQFCSTYPPNKLFFKVWVGSIFLWREPQDVHHRRSTCGSPCPQPDINTPTSSSRNQDSNANPREITRRVGWFACKILDQCFPLSKGKQLDHRWTGDLSQPFADDNPPDYWSHNESM